MVIFQQISLLNCKLMVKKENPKKKQRCIERQRERRAEYKKLGLCIDCREKALPNKWRCEVHRVLLNSTRKRSRINLRIKWRSNNRCIRCGSNLNPEMDGTCVKCLNCRIETHMPFKKSDFRF